MMARPPMVLIRELILAGVEQVIEDPPFKRVRAVDQVWAERQKVVDEVIEFYADDLKPYAEQTDA